MPGRNAGLAGAPLGNGTLIGDTLIWNGGQGEFGCKGNKGTVERFALILEDDLTGDFAPSGDAVIHHVGQRLTFVLPAGTNVRVRLNGDSPTTQLEPFIAP